MGFNPQTMEAGLEIILTGLPAPGVPLALSLTSEDSRNLSLSPILIYLIFKYDISQHYSPPMLRIVPSYRDNTLKTHNYEGAILCRFDRSLKGKLCCISVKLDVIKEQFSDEDDDITHYVMYTSTPPLKTKSRHDANFVVTVDRDLTWVFFCRIDICLLPFTYNCTILRRKRLL